MTFMVMDTYSYDVLLGLDFLIKISAIMDVEWGLIQLRHGLRTHVEVLPLTMVNMLQRMNSKTLMRNVVATLENTHLSGISDVAIRNPSLYDPIMPKQVDALMLDSDYDTDDNEHCGERPQLAESNNDEYGFGNIELENLVLTKKPQQILKLILQGQVDDFMEEKITDINDYVNWIKWVFDAKERNCCNCSFGLATKAKGLQRCGPRGSPGVKAKRLQRCGPRRSLGIMLTYPQECKKM
jgi:hypothetical protein